MLTSLLEPLLSHLTGNYWYYTIGPPLHHWPLRPHIHPAQQLFPAPAPQYPAPTPALQGVRQDPGGVTIASTPALQPELELEVGAGSGVARVTRLSRLAGAAPLSTASHPGLFFCIVTLLYFR